MAGDRYGLGAVKPWVRAAANELGPKFGISVIGGYRASAKDKNGHPAGRALDLMVSDKERGTRLAEYARANARRLGVEYVIWRQRIWSVGRNGEGWRPMEDRGSPTQNHMDHVHVNFNATAPNGGGAVVDQPTPTWKPNKAGNTGAGGGSGHASGGGGRGVGLTQGIGVPGLPDGDTIRDMAVTGAALLGGVALIALGFAAVAAKGIKKHSGEATEAAMTAAQFMPQGKAATAASGAATAAQASKTTPTTKGF